MQYLIDHRIYAIAIIAIVAVVYSIRAVYHKAFSDPYEKGGKRG